MSILSTSAFLISFGFLPSFVWLIYYLKKDCHPEPKSMIAKTTLLGILVAPLAVIAQLIFTRVMTYLGFPIDSSSSLLFFLWAAFVEEYVKYLAVKLIVFNSPEFDEPTDAMIYMISASLGFAAVENIIVLFQNLPNGFGATLQIWLLRFAGATLLHAVSAALMGYFLALSWFYQQHSKRLIVAGLAAATFCHFVFNVSLLAADSQMTGFIYSSLGLIAMIILISFLFNKIKRRMVENTVVN